MVTSANFSDCWSTSKSKADIFLIKLLWSVSSYLNINEKKKKLDKKEAYLNFN